jgi:hypothetical protein
MSSIIRRGETYHGISVFGRGVFTNDEYGYTYAGQHKDGYACGLGVLKWPAGYIYAEHGRNGEYDGRHLYRSANGTTDYRLYERGEQKEYAVVSADGTCNYKGVACAPDDPRVLALKAQIAPVEVRPAARTPHPATRQPTRPQAIVRWIGRLGLPPQALAAAVATEVHPHAARRRWWLGDTTQQQPRCPARPRNDACTGRFAVVVSREAPSCILTNRRRVHTKDSLPCHSPARRRTEQWHAQAGLHVCVRTPH